MLPTAGRIDGEPSKEHTVEDNNCLPDWLRSTLPGVTSSCATARGNLAVGARANHLPTQFRNSGREIIKMGPKQCHKQCNTFVRFLCYE